MPDPHTPVSEYVKQGVFIIVLVALCLFGVKTCRKFQAEKRVVIALASNASESAAYEQFYRENAEQNLFKAMFQMHSGVGFGLTPDEIVDKVMRQETGGLFSTEKAPKLPLRKVLIREALLSNYDNCLKLGVFENRLNLNALEAGEPPAITRGPAEGEDVVVRQIIPAAVLPGADKLLPNLAISPPRATKGKPAPPTDFDIVRAKRLAQQLASAGLIERDTYNKVVKHYKGAAEKPSAAETQPTDAR